MTDDLFDDPFDDPRLTLSGLFWEVVAAYRANLETVWARLGLAGSDFDVIIRVARSPGRRLRMSDLATQTGMSTSGITRVVDRLERDRLLTREASPSDRRSMLAVLTDSGAERLAALMPELVRVIQRCLVDPLPPDRQESFAAALRTIRDTIHPGATAGAGVEHDSR